MRYPWARRDSTCFHTAARVSPSLPEIASPETNSSPASARNARTSSSEFWDSPAMGPGTSTQLERDVHRPRRVGDRAHGDEVDAGGGDLRQAGERHVPARLEEHPPRRAAHRLGDGGVVHVVEEDDVRPGGDRLVEPGEVDDLHLHPEHGA